MGYAESPNEWVHFCYVHAAEAKLIELALGEVRDLSEKSGYPENAIAFVMESLYSAEVETADEVAEAVMENAQERFRGSSQIVLTSWMILQNRDIGEIAMGLGQLELIRLPETLAREDFNGPLKLGGGE